MADCMQFLSEYRLSMCQILDGSVFENGFQTKFRFSTHFC